MARQQSLLRFLHELEKEELIEEIEKLCAKFEVVKKYFDVELSGDTTRHLEAARKDITRQFQTSKGAWRKNPKASRLNAIIKDFELISIYKTDVLELLVHRVEETLRYAFGADETVSTALTQSTELIMRRALAQMAAEGIEDTYRSRIQGWDNPNWRYGRPREWVKPEGAWWNW